MEEKIVRRSGAKVSGNESSLDAIHEAMPHWIHHTREDQNYLGGVVYLPGCSCSVCGFSVSAERDRCPHCGVKMVRGKW